MSKKVVALGFFDGVHIGHGALLGKARERAEKIGAEACVMTYSRHPSEVVGKTPVKLINSTEERCEIIKSQYGIESIVIKDFTKEYANLSCEEFFRKIIIEELSACGVVAGYDFRFGKNGAGDKNTLESLCSENGITCDIIDAVKLDDEIVSSSAIRALLAKGDVKNAARLLGHNHCMISEITHGRNLGSAIGFPTINQIPGDNVLLPKFGVYVSKVIIGGNAFCGITNIGIRPTVAENEPPRAETFILDFSGDLYGEKIKVELLDFLREEKKFSSLEELSCQISCDEESARRFNLADF